MKPLKDKVAIVTGAGHPKGIGRAIAMKLAEQGATLVVTDLESASAGLEEAVSGLHTLGTTVMAVTVDVTDKAQIRSCVSRVLREFGRIDVLVNNAGVGLGSGEFLEVTDQDWQLSYAVNIKGTADFCQAVIPAMKQQGGGAIINVASLAGLGAIETIPACYTASKYAVVGLTKQLALNYAADQIRINAVCPGSVVTQMHQTSLELIASEHNISIEEAQRQEDAHIPLGYSADPGVIGDAVAYLAGSGAAYITGVAMPVAGGMAPGL